MSTSTEQWKELALTDPLFKWILITVAGKHYYAADIIPLRPAKEGPRNLAFELTYPLYTAVREIIEADKDEKTRSIKLEVESKEHMWIEYAVTFPVDQWSYTQMEDVMKGLEEQLERQQDFNRGFFIQIIFI